MRIASTITRVLMWVALVVYSVMQFLAAYGIVVENNLRAVEQEMPEKVYNVVPLVVITLLMILAVILFTVWKKRPYIGLALSAVAGIALLVTTLSMSRAFPSGKPQALPHQILSLGIDYRSCAQLLRLLGDLHTKQ